MFTYRNNGGAHVMADGEVIAHGDTFTCDDGNIGTTFENKFERVYSDQGSGSGTKRGIVGAAVDVTDEFEGAVENDLRVVKDKNKWFIFDGDDQVNDAGLKKSDVEAAIMAYSAESE